MHGWAWGLGIGQGVRAVFAMLSKLAEILAQFGTTFVALRRTVKDTDVAAAMVSTAMAIQDLCVRGERILTLLDQTLDGAAHVALAEEIASLLDLQVAAAVALRSSLADSQALLATIDAGLYVELVPFLDQKSGLIIRWSQHVAQGRHSTTAIFFLSPEDLDHLIAVGKSHASSEGLTYDRSAYVLAYMDGMRAARAREVRDLSRVVAEHRVPVVKQEIATARDDLDRVKALCDQLLAATQQAVGPEVMAHLRRTLVPKSARD